MSLASARQRPENQKDNHDDEFHNKPAHAVPLASARQHLENQKEDQAGHSSERAVEGQQQLRPVDSDDAILPYEMLPWGCHYRNLVSKAGHAWVAADLSADPQVARAKPRDGDGDRRGYGRLGSDGRRALRGRKRTGKETTRVAGATGTGNVRVWVR